MFLIAGVHSKVKDCGIAPNGRCPVCGSEGMLHITNQYMTPHVFFIPTFRFHCNYIATCGSCASAMQLNREKGRAIERGQPVQITLDDLQVLQNNRAPICPRCGERLPPGSAFCNRCGQPL